MSSKLLSRQILQIRLSKIQILALFLLLVSPTSQSLAATGSSTARPVLLCEETSKFFFSLPKSGACPRGSKKVSIDPKVIVQLGKMIQKPLPLKGNVILNGTSDPTSDIGTTGDFYINT